MSAASSLLIFILLKQSNSGIQIVSKEEAKRIKSDYLLPIRERIEVMMTAKEQSEDPAQLANRVELLRESLKRLC